MPYKPAVMFVDTGTLLTLLLGHHEDVSHNQQAGETGNQRAGNLPANLGYAALLLSMARKGLVEIKLTDMVVAEFLGLQGPVSDQDIKNGKLTADHIPNGFQFRQERITLLSELLESKHAQIVPTKAGHEQLERTRLILQSIIKPKKRAMFCEAGDTSWVEGKIDSEDGKIDSEDLRTRLLNSGSKLSSAVRRNGLILKPKDMNNSLLQDPNYFVQGQIYSNYSDRGEISIADALGTWQKKNPDQSPIILFEGGDVRGRIIQRMWFNRELESGKSIIYGASTGEDKLNATTQNIEAYHYHQVGKPRARFNPNCKTFQTKDIDEDGQNVRYIDHLGDFNFLTTKSFLHGLVNHVITIRTTPKRGYGSAVNSELYVLSPEEKNLSPFAASDAPQAAIKNQSIMDTIYNGIIQQVQSNGLPRSYHQSHDEAIRNVTHEESACSVFKAPQVASPWQKALRDIYRNETEVNKLESVLTEFSQYRSQETFHACAGLFLEIIKQVATLPEKMANEMSAYATKGIALLEHFAKQTNPDRAVASR